MPDFVDEMVKALAAKAGTGVLTDDQRDAILEIVREQVYEYAVQDSGYLHGLVETYVEKLDYKTAVEVAECDEDYWPQRFPFHPLTGEPWPEDDEGECD